MNEKLKKILDLIEASRNILITSHRDPDGDSIGSQLALAELVESRGKRYQIINQGGLPSKYVFLDPERKIKKAETIRNQRDAGADWDLVLVLDSTSKGRLGQVEKMIPSKATLVNIDHHPDNDQFGNFNYVDVNASAVGEIIFFLLKVADFSFTPKVAAQLYAAILTDTGRFKFSNTSSRCLKVCAELLELGADPKSITNRIYFEHSFSFLRLLGSVLKNPKILAQGRICAMTVKQKLLQKLGVDPQEVEGLVNYSLFLKGVQIGLLFTERKGGETKVNLRSQNDFDVGRVARIFGGGGHRNAAGCTLNHSLEEAKDIIVELIQRDLENEPVRNLTS